MALKLALGSITLGACVLLAGCQQSAGPRLASRGPAQPIMARPNQMPAPNFPAASPSGPTANAGFRSPTTPTPGAFNTSTPSSFPSAGSFPGAANNSSSTLNPTPTKTGNGGLAPIHPQTAIPTSNAGRPNTVVFTQPGTGPALPLPSGPPESSGPTLTAPGITPLPPLP